MHAEKQGWTVVDSKPAADLGTSLLHPAFRSGSAMQGRFVIVLAEPMDRLTLTAANRAAWAGQTLQQILQGNS
ncbi:hypothetical protein [Mesorhizobium sp. M0488]|uniref:hypothetical protein n=1 Tax=unclassified Mesorhizobium TaxID=325217 RepID=UPI003339A1D2